jgi:ubiquinone/menaquinone biosynthesis C-methylase UbiE
VRTSILRYLIPERIPWFAARLYDKIAGEALDSYYRQVAREIVSVRDRGSILDIGTGPGFLPIEIARIAPGIDLHAIDLSRRMIKLAGLHALKTGVAHRISFRAADANRLPFEPETFDMIVSTGALHSWKHPVRVIDECYRVLKPGTEAWIYDPAKIVGPEMENLLRTGLSGIDRLAYAYASWTTKLTRQLTPAEIQQIISKVDFKSAQVDHTQWVRIILRK